MHFRKDSVRRRRRKLNLKPAEQNSNRNWDCRTNSWWRHNLISRQELFDWHRIQSALDEARSKQLAQEVPDSPHPLRAKSTILTNNSFTKRLCRA